MSSYVTRQLELMRGFVEGYRSHEIALNLLVRRIEALLDVVDSEALRSSVFPFLLNIEEVNAVSLDEGSELDARQNEIVNDSLEDLERVLFEFEKDL